MKIRYSGAKFGGRGYIAEFASLACVFFAACVFIGYAASVIFDSPTADGNENDSIAAAGDVSRVVVIDPGHGGEDGGAVSEDGVLEKDLNLEFARSFRAIANALGIDTSMTREKDELLYDRYSDLTDYTGRKKVYDLKNRLRFTNETGDGAIFFGIHMNKFSDSKYSGTQIYYSPNTTESEDLAEILRTKIKENLQPDNNRETKKAGSSIYLLKRLKTPAVLVECGFLSNAEETARLKDEVYRKEFSLTAAAAIGEFIASAG